jgi:hypothetical protein
MEGTAMRKSAVQQLQEKMQKEIDCKDAELSAFKDKTKIYIEQLKKKHSDAMLQSSHEIEALQVQVLQPRCVPVRSR